MPTQTTYTYTISTDTANAKVDLSKLKEDIQESSIIIALDYINTNGDVLDVLMKDVMPDDASGASASLAAIVSAHDGVASLNVPVLKDAAGKEMVHETSRGLGLITYFTSEGDSTSPDSTSTSCSLRAEKFRFLLR